MTYRDDREALQARVEALESELVTQKSHYEQELDALRVGVTPPSRRRSRLLVGGIAAAGVLLGGIVAGLLATSSSTRSDEPVVELAPTPPVVMAGLGVRPARPIGPAQAHRTSPSPTAAVRSQSHRSRSTPPSASPTCTTAR